jgi:transaldolase/glucose-6-phosphate isomerase
MSSALETAIAARLERWGSENVAVRLWDKDGSLWAESGKDADEVARWLGWLDLPEAMSARVTELEHLARDVAEDGYRRAAVLGMGGSSLAPELFAHTFGPPGGGPARDDRMDLRVLDSTHPDAVRGFREWAASARTLFCVSSKSGTTTEPNAFHAAMAEMAPALDFLAITDPDTALAELARAQEFRGIVEAPTDVGGRYSALTVFGLVPAALHGVDLKRLLASARDMADACRRPARDNPGLRLGAFIGEAGLVGRDKLTLLTDERISSFGAWVEQLIAESTGKAGRGVVPVVGETPGRIDGYADDRAFVLIHLADDAARDWPGLADDLRRAGHPVVRIALDDRYDLGGELVRWEVATAAAGIVLGIDPFDQPNVQESKDATKRLLDAYRRDGTLPVPAQLVAEPGISATADPAAIGGDAVTVEGAVSQLLATVRPGTDYVAVLAYLPPDEEVLDRLARIRLALREGLGAATTVGIGPRFLHSTGQLHKGGPPNGVFLQLTAEPRRDLPIPGWQETFGTLIAAQALGDLESLQARGRRALRLHLGELSAGLDRVEELVGAALSVSVAAGTPSAPD